MRKKMRYDVYDIKEKKMVMEDVFSREVTNRFGKSVCPCTYASEQKLYHKRFKITFSKKMLEEDSCNDEGVTNSEFAKEWKRACALFKNVIWVKESDCNYKRLKINKAIKKCNATTV